MLCLIFLGPGTTPKRFLDPESPGFRLGIIKFHWNPIAFLYFQYLQIFDIISSCAAAVPRPRPSPGGGSAYPPPRCPPIPGQSRSKNIQTSLYFFAWILGFWWSRGGPEGVPGGLGGVPGHVGGLSGQLGGSWGASGGASGPSWAVLGRLGGRLGLSWGRSGASCGRLGWLLGGLGEILGRLGAVLVALGRVPGPPGSVLELSWSPLGP